eukprot:1111601-Rhodomonas_salina.3
MITVRNVAQVAFQKIPSRVPTGMGACGHRAPDAIWQIPKIRDIHVIIWDGIFWDGQAKRCRRVARGPH